MPPQATSPAPVPSQKPTPPRGTKLILAGCIFPFAALLFVYIVVDVTIAPTLKDGANESLRASVKLIPVGMALITWVVSPFLIIMGILRERTYKRSLSQATPAPPSVPPVPPIAPAT